MAVASWSSFLGIRRVDGWNCYVPYFRCDSNLIWFCGYSYYLFSCVSSYELNNMGDAGSLLMKAEGAEGESPKTYLSAVLYATF